MTWILLTCTHVYVLAAHATVFLSTHVGMQISSWAELPAVSSDERTEKAFQLGFDNRSGTYAGSELKYIAHAGCCIST